MRRVKKITADYNVKQFRTGCKAFTVLILKYLNLPNNNTVKHRPLSASLTNDPSIDLVIGGDANEKILTAIAKIKNMENH